MSNKPELYIPMNCVIGEGPVWDERDQTLYFIDLLGGKIYHKAETLEKLDVGETVGCIALRERGGMIAGLKSGWYFMDFPSGKREFISWPEGDRTGSRFNDGKADPAGRMWSGTMPTTLDTGEGEAGPDSALYSLDQKLNVKQMASGIIQGNGMAWTADTKQFYFIDTQSRHVLGFDYDIGTNVLTNQRIAVTVPEKDGIPDGMTIDDEGRLWIALWGGNAVGVWDPRSGTLLEKIEVPAKNVTACCFGGADMKDLFITTASLGTDLERYPQAGSVFRLRTDVSGAKSFRFGG